MKHLLLHLSLLFVCTLFAQAPKTASTDLSYAFSQRMAATSISFVFNAGEPVTYTNGFSLSYRLRIPIQRDGEGKWDFTDVNDVPSEKEATVDFSQDDLSLTFLKTLLKDTLLRRDLNDRFLSPMSLYPTNLERPCVTEILPALQRYLSQGERCYPHTGFLPYVRRGSYSSLEGPLRLDALAEPGRFTVTETAARTIRVEYNPESGEAAGFFTLFGRYGTWSNEVKFKVLLENNGESIPISVEVDPYLGLLTQASLKLVLSSSNTKSLVAIRGGDSALREILLPTARFFVDLRLCPAASPGKPNRYENYFVSDDGESFELNAAEAAGKMTIRLFRNLRIAQDRATFEIECGELTPRGDAFIGKAKDGSELRLTKTDSGCTVSWEPANLRKPIQFSRAD